MRETKYLFKLLDDYTNGFRAGVKGVSFMDPINKSAYSLGINDGIQHRKELELKALLAQEKPDIYANLYAPDVPYRLWKKGVITAEEMGEIYEE